MTVYWILLAFPAFMALTYPHLAPRNYTNPAQNTAMTLFVLLYVLIGGLRWETGGDWMNYIEIYTLVEIGTLAEAVTTSDPFYGFLNWIGARTGGGIYLVNFVCCWILGYGTVAVARTFREPWMAIVIAVPYLLIVVGLGYVRQGAAIGLVLMAIANLDRGRPLRTIAFLGLATGFHATAVIVYPFFALSSGQRNRALGIAASILALAIYQAILAPRLDSFDTAYIGGEYDSQGATVRVLMGAIPAALMLLLRDRFAARPQARVAWLAVSVANLLAFAALGVSPSSTAVDRVALYFSTIQLAAFGEFRDLVALSPRNVMIIRFGMISLAVAVQLVWLVFALHSFMWVPYKSVLDAVPS